MPLRPGIGHTGDRCAGRRFDDLSVDVYADPDTHLGRLIRACWDLGAHEPYWRLRRWAHQYGCGGHITTKSRAFSATYGFLRMKRTIWRRTEGHPHTWDDTQTDLVVYRLGYEATGWITTGDALLANSAADAARARTQAARDALDDERYAVAADLRKGRLTRTCQRTIEQAGRITSDGQAADRRTSGGDSRYH